jgi:type IV secretory pathway VirB6-like protein
MELLGSLYFRLVSGYIDQKFFEASGRVSDNLGQIFVAAGLAAFTLYFVLIGIRISTGDSRESMSSILFRTAKMLFLFTILSSAALGSQYIQSNIMNIRSQVLGAFDGSGGSGSNVYAKLDDNLTKMSVSMTLINSVNVGSDVGVADAKSRALTMGIFGQTAPSVVAGCLVLINELGMRIAIMLAPIFIAAFMFRRTEGMFFEWIKFLISSTLSLGVLSMTIQIMSDLSLLFFGIIETFRTAADTGFVDNLPQLDESVMIASFGVMMSAMLCTVPMMVNKIMAAGLDYSQPQSMGGGQRGGSASSHTNNSYAGNASRSNEPAREASVNTSHNNAGTQATGNLNLATGARRLVE